MKYQQLLTWLFILFVTCSCSNVRLNPGSSFQGTWKLDKYESFDSVAGKWFPSPKRTGYTGYIIYDGMGHMAVQLLPPKYNGFDNSPNIDSLSNDEMKRILKLQLTSFCYFANYTVSEKDHSIEHHKISSNDPKEPGTTATRDFEFFGDTLILTAKESIGGLKTRLKWIKI